MDKSGMITGQVFVRHTSTGPTTPDGRTLVILTGIVAVPLHILERLGRECQYTVYGR